jgi:hypothetical protein
LREACQPALSATARSACELVRALIATNGSAGLEIGWERSSVALPTVN